MKQFDIFDYIENPADIRAKHDMFFHTADDNYIIVRKSEGLPQGEEITHDEFVAGVARIARGL